MLLFKSGNTLKVIRNSIMEKYIAIFPAKGMVEDFFLLTISETNLTINEITEAESINKQKLIGLKKGVIVIKKNISPNPIILFKI